MDRLVLAERIARWLFILMPVLLLAVLLVRPIYDVDIFWQLKLGEMALDRGVLVAQEPFAANHLGEPLAQLAWLGQVIMAMVRRWGGWSALQVFDALVWLGGFLAAAWASRRAFGSVPGVIAALVLSFAAGLSSASLRPQSFAVLGFGLLIAVLASQWHRNSKLAAAAAILVLWQNLHPSTGVAVLFLGASAGWAWLGKLSGRRNEWPVEETALAAIASLAMFFTPTGTGIFGLSAQNAAASASMAANEWQPMWSKANAEIWLLLLPAPVLFLLLIALRRRSLDWNWLVPCLLLLAVSLFAVRFILFWAIAAIPVLSSAFAERTQNNQLARRDCALSAIGLGMAVTLALAWHEPRFSDAIPLKAISALKQSGVRGTVYSELPWGGPLIDGGFPDIRVALDGRYYVYTGAELKLARTAGMSADGLAAIERTWNPAAILIHPLGSPVLLASLKSEPADWRVIHADGNSTAFVRITGRPPAAPSVP